MLLVTGLMYHVACAIPYTIRQKRVDRQREYAEALRRDMATPKVDSLGR